MANEGLQTAPFSGKRRIDGQMHGTELMNSGMRAFLQSGRDPDTDPVA